jgi:intermediate peptidase
MERLNQDLTIYNALRRFNNKYKTNRELQIIQNANPEATNKFLVCTDEQHRVSYLFEHEMEQNAIGKQMAIQTRVRDLKASILTLMHEFSRNINDHREVFRIPISSRSQFNTLFSNLPSSYLQRIEYVDQKPQPYLKIPSEFDMIDIIMRWVRNGLFRRQVYYAGNRIHPANIRILDELVKCRNELAACMNHPSYSHFHVRSLLAKTPANVIRFLKILLEESKSRAQEELNVIRLYKHHDLSQNQSRSNSNCSLPNKNPQSQQFIDDTIVQSWDCAYYMGLLKSSQLALDNNTLASYFSLSNCINGIDLIMSSLFNVRVKRGKLQSGEDWTENYSDRLEDEVIKLEAYDEVDGRLLGIVYLDLFLRPSKFRGTAAFVIQAAREISENTLETLPTNTTANGSNKRRQYPVLAIVAGWPRSGPSEPILLSHGCLQALFHEWGHATHHLLCRNQYQHLSGARGELDFVELPSTLFENFAWDYRVLSKFAFHHETGKVIPHEMVSNLNISRDMFFGLDTHLSALQSLFDHYVFSNGIYDDELIKPCVPGLDDLKSEGNFTQSKSSLDDLKYAISSPSTQLYHAINTTFSLFPTHPTLFPHANNNHLCHYGSGYYTYLMCRVYSTAMWSKYFAHNPLSRESGQLYRNAILQHGGSRDPELILRETLGDEFQQTSIRDFISERVKHKDLE